ncbi:hypothetical protein [Brachybacterium vulturis]|nr:hypothetical protein [Brachybacterium vulturis]
MSVLIDADAGSAERVIRGVDRPRMTPGRGARSAADGGPGPLQ